MEWDYLYADLGVNVRFNVGLHSPFCNLTDRETLALQQLVYMTLNAFVYTRTLYAADVAALQIRIDAEKKTLKDKKGGG